jgi:5-formyltetrahydrofolate cyclo-ligase
VTADLAQAKRAARARVRQARAASALDPTAVAERLLAAARAAGLLDPPGAKDGPRIAAYVAAPGEPDPAAIRTAVRAAGGIVLLPVPLSGRTLGWALDDGRYLPGERFPVPQPAGPQLGTGVGPLVAAHVGLVLAPALAVDRSGTRLGQGGGYYDTVLAALAEVAQPPRVVVVVHDDELLPAGTLPRGPHDAPIAEVLTPGGLVTLPG